jgi:benzodiazapine receptor
LDVSLGFVPRCPDTASTPSSRYSDTIRYLAEAIWLVWQQKGFADAKQPLALFAIQLALNSLWSTLFFGLQRSDLAAIEIVLLWTAILATTIAFWFRSKWAGALLVPYLTWVSFAGVLNFTIWRMNA